MHEIKKGPLKYLLIFVYFDVSKILLQLGIAVPTPVTINMPTVNESCSIIIAPIAMYIVSLPCRIYSAIYICV